MIPRRRDRCGGLISGHQPHHGRQMHAQRRPGPLAQRREGRVLARAKFDRRVRKVTEQIRLGVAGRFCGKLLAGLRRAVDRHIGHSGGEHGLKIDPLLLTVPFIGDRPGEIATGRDQLTSQRGQDRPAVQTNRPAVCRLLG